MADVEARTPLAESNAILFYFAEGTPYLPADKLERAAIDGLVGATDRWSEYFTAAEWREWSARVMSGRLTGVGIRVEADAKSGYIRVLSPIENSPAFDAGVLPGDQIIKVDGEDIHNRSLEEVTGRIKGDPGTKVVLTIHRGDLEPFDVTLTRAEIKVRAVKHRMAESGIGYIRIDDFTEAVPADVEGALKDLESKGMKGLVVDLRFVVGEEDARRGDDELETVVIEAAQHREERPFVTEADEHEPAGVGETGQAGVEDDLGGVVGGRFGRAADHRRKSTRVGWITLAVAPSAA